MHKFSLSHYTLSQVSKECTLFTSIARFGNLNSHGFTDESIYLNWAGITVLSVSSHQYAQAGVDEKTEASSR